MKLLPSSARCAFGPDRGTIETTIAISLSKKTQHYELILTIDAFAVRAVSLSLSQLNSNKKGIRITTRADLKKIFRRVLTSASSLRMANS